MANILLIIFGLYIYSASGQSCYNYGGSDCATCLGANGQGGGGGGCVYSPRCGSCYPTFNYNSASCGTGLTSAAQCPTIPSAVEAARPLSSAYGVLGLAAIAVALTAVAAYSNVEQSCCARGKPTPRTALGLNHHLLFLSSCFLWFGLSLGLAAPALPWLVAVGPTSVTAASAFSLFFCGFASATNDYSLCSQLTLVQYVANGGLAMDDQALAQRGLALGVVAYIVLIGLLLPSAVITSIATYRFSKSTKQGTPAYTSGCSPASLFVAQLLGWPAFFTFSIVAFIAISVCSTVATRIKSQFDGLPGIVAAMVSVALLLLGLILQAIVARALKDVRGVGCNSGGCCCATDSAASGGAPLSGPTAVITSPFASANAPQVVAPQPQAGGWVRQTDGKECVACAVQAREGG
jgi:hypothetical protein